MSLKLVIDEDVNFNIVKSLKNNNFNLFSILEETPGIIFLRYNFQELDTIQKSLFNILDTYKQNLLGKFILLTPKKIRIREI